MAVMAFVGKAADVDAIHRVEHRHAGLLAHLEQFDVLRRVDVPAGEDAPSHIRIEHQVLFEKLAQAGVAFGAHQARRQCAWTR
jgi:hypothetical protein